MKWVTNQLVEAYPLETNLLIRELLEFLRSKGRASGRYLLSTQIKLQETDAEDSWLRSIKKKIEDDPYPPRRVYGKYKLWPNKLFYNPLPRIDTPERAEIFRLVKESVDFEWISPFGPENAEEDPRLPSRQAGDDHRPVNGLFWTDHPSWAEAKNPRHSFFFISPGCGRSALIWMGRHTNRYWGRNPGLSFYIAIGGKPTQENLINILEKAIGNSILSSLSEDPFWLFDADKAIKELITSFLVCFCQSKTRPDARENRAHLGLI